MALARLALKNLGERVVSPCCYSLVSQSFAEKSIGTAQNQRWSSEILKGFAAKPSGGDVQSKGQEVAVEEADKESKLSPKRNHRKKGLWRKDNNDIVPALHGTLTLSLSLSRSRWITTVHAFMCTHGVIIYTKNENIKQRTFHVGDT